MKTFEGTMLIKWYKNDNGDKRPLTIDAPDKQALNAVLRETRRLFMTEPELDGDTEQPLAHSVSFDMRERP